MAAKDPPDSGVRFEFIEYSRPRPSAVPSPPSARQGGRQPQPAPVPEKLESPPPAMSPPARPSLSPAAARMRLSRQRHKEGFRTVSVDVHEADVDALIRRGHLRSEEREDRRAIEEAVEFFLESEL
jgi:hypothetical protein